jgi:hypothetical protein
MVEKHVKVQFHTKVRRCVVIQDAGLIGIAVLPSSQRYQSQGAHNQPSNCSPACISGRNAAACADGGSAMGDGTIVLVRPHVLPQGPRPMHKALAFQTRRQTDALLSSYSRYSDSELARRHVVGGRREARPPLGHGEGEACVGLQVFKSFPFASLILHFMLQAW